MLSRRLRLFDGVALACREIFEMASTPHALRWLAETALPTTPRVAALPVFEPAYECVRNR